MRRFRQFFTLVVMSGACVALAAPASPPADVLDALPNLEGTPQPPPDGGQLNVPREPGSFLLASVDAVPFPDIRDVTQDDQGFIWFAANHPTEGGLLRFDGYNLKKYVHDPGDPNSISNGQASVTYVDNESVLWVGTIRGGLNRYNAATDDFTRFLHDPDDLTTLPSDAIRGVAQTSDGTHWVCTDNGLAHSQPDGTWERLQHDEDDPDSLPDNEITSLVEDPSTGELWIGTGRGLARRDPDTGSFTSYSSDEDAPGSLSDDQVEEVMFDRAGTLWVATRDGLNRYNPTTDDFTSYRHDPDDPTSLRAPWIWSMLEDTQGRFWVGLSQGMQLFDRATGTARDIADAATRDAVLQDAPVRSLIEDDAGAIWIGTQNAGTARISPFARTLTYFRHDDNDVESISSDFVARIEPTGEGVWVITDTGVDFFDGTTFTHYNEMFNLDKGWPALQGLLAARDDSLWIGTNDGKIIHADPTSGDTEQFSLPPPGDSAGVWPVSEAANGDIWFRTTGFGVGVHRVDGTTELLIGDSVDESGPERAYVYNTHSFFDDDAQVLWVTGLGLTAIDTTSGEVTSYYYNDDNPEDVVNQLWSVEQGPDGHLWLASSNGVHEFDPKSGRFLKLHRDLPIPGTTDARFGPDGRLWLVSGSTLTGLDTQSGATITYDATDETIGATHLEQESWVVSKFETAPDGRLIAPTIGNGLVAFSPTSISNNPFVPPIVLTNAELFGNPLPIGPEGASATPINRSDELAFGPNQDTFAIEFAALDYEQPERNQYRYRLRGFDDEWHHTDADRRFATYTNVPPGSYQFEVQGSNNSGLWNPQSRSLSVTVATAWYDTLWFRVLVAALAAMAIISLWWVRNRRRVQAQRERERQLDAQARAQEERAVLLDAIEEQSERIRAILAAAPVGVVLLGPDCDVLLKNRVADEEFDIIADVSSDGRLISVGDTPVDELIGDDQMGSWRTATFDRIDYRQFLSITVRPIESGPDGRKGWVLLWDDITELQALQQRTARQQRLAEIGRFAAGIAHDVNNVLTVIGLNAELLNLEADVGRPARKRLANISSQTGKATRFIGQILDYARPTIANPEVFNLHVLVVTMVERLKDTVPPGVEVIYQGQGGPFVQGDPFQIERIVMNLFTNALHAVSDEGHITVRVEQVTNPLIVNANDQQTNRSASSSQGLLGPGTGRSGTGEDGQGEATPRATEHVAPGTSLAHSSAAGWARLSVTDDGAGIEDGILDAIFEPFFTTKQVGHGTGLGLSQVASIASEHDGSVSVITSHGEGSTFVVQLPAVELSATAEIALTPTTTPAAGRQGAGESVLIVDDEADVRHALGEVLTTYGYSVTAAGDGAEALQILDTGTQFDLIISDIMMPDIGGGELLSAIDQRSIDTPVVLMSGVVDRFNALTGHHLVSASIPKPIDVDNLLAEIGAALVDEGGARTG